MDVSDAKLLHTMRKNHYFNLPDKCSSGLSGLSGLLGLSGLSGLSRLSKGVVMLLGLSGFCSRFSSSLKESEIINKKLVLINATFYMVRML
jgi:hypothetical protein